MTKRYGAPYIGSKNNIAEDVIDFLPSGKRLCDLFGGGGAISHCALTYGRNKYGSVLYNDFNPMVVEYVRSVFSGELDADLYEPDIITRDAFNYLKNKRGDVAFIWSYGNNGLDYLWGKEKEELKLLAYAMLTRKTVRERYRYYRKFVKALLEHGAVTRKDRLDMIQTADSLNRIKEIERVQPDRVQYTNLSYSEYEYEYGDVVYCDIPYEKGKGKVPYAKFDFKEFYDWAYSRPYPVYISSYDISDNRFRGYPISRRRQLLSKTNDDNRLEMIYMNQAAVEEKSQEMFLL